MNNNKQRVSQFFEKFSGGDLEGVAEAMHPEGCWWVSGRIEGLSGTYPRAEFIKLLEGVRDFYQEGALSITPDTMIAEGDKVAVEAESHATLQNGKVYDNHYHFLIEFKDDKIFKVKEYMDTKLAFETFMA